MQTIGFANYFNRCFTTRCFIISTGSKIRTGFHALYSAPIHLIQQIAALWMSCLQVIKIDSAANFTVYLQHVNDVL